MSAKVEDELAVARRKWQNKISERDRCMREEGGGGFPLAFVTLCCACFGRFVIPI